MEWTEACWKSWKLASGGSRAWAVGAYLILWGLGREICTSLFIFCEWRNLKEWIRGKGLRKGRELFLVVRGVGFWGFRLVMESVSGEEIEKDETFSRLSFREAKKGLRINALVDLQTLKGFTHTEEVQRHILNTVVRLILLKDFTCDSDWELIGFPNSQQVLDYLKDNQGLYLLLNLLFLFDTDPIDIQPEQKSSIIFDCSKISKRLVTLLQENKISNISKFFVFFSSAAHCLKKDENLDNVNVEDFQKMLDKRISAQINFNAVV